MTVEPFIANTDRAWFDYLRGRATGGRLDEVNFWSPRSQRPMKRLMPGEPVFFRLKSPDQAIAGYGFFAHFTVLDLREAWRFFGEKNGDPYEASFRLRIGKYRGIDLLDPRSPEAPLGCTVLRDARFWPEPTWIPWGVSMGWANTIIQGKSERDAGRARLLLDRVTQDAHFEETQGEWASSFELLDVDERRREDALVVVREGQGAFRTRVLDAYGGRCAITGERTRPVLDAAHIQRYLGPRSNHVQNGLLLTKEFHTLFDLGYVTVTPDHEVRVSSALRDEWHNGHRYYAFDGERLRNMPAEAVDRPSRPALEWHGSVRFRN